MIIIYIESIKTYHIIILNILDKITVWNGKIQTNLHINFLHFMLKTIMIKDGAL